jgi:peptidoglycan/xylan/chitin deacetylase (PgdA/CDA1 family)
MFPELHGKVPENRAGVALTFDDAHIDEWYEMGDVLAEYGARATFFVARFHRLSDDENRKLHELYEAGHAIESHGVNHKDALEFSRERSVQEYVDEEVIPSLEAMRADGFSPTTFAYPKGTRSGALDEAILQHVELVRTLQWSLGHPFLYNPASWE